MFLAGVIDWPWAAEPDNDDPPARGYYPYPTMSHSQIVAYARDKVRPILARDCVVAMWITNFHLVRGYHVAILEALGLKGVTIRTWIKTTMGQGQVLRGQTEHAIIATCGKPILTVGNLTTRFEAPANRKAHSQKPQVFYDDFMQLVAAPRYFTLFERVDRGAKWIGHGDDCPAPIAAPPANPQRSAANKIVGLAGHSFRLSIAEERPPLPCPANVATCECGAVYRTSRDLPAEGMAELEKHIATHWRTHAPTADAYAAAIAAACFPSEQIEDRAAQIEQIGATIAVAAAASDGAAARAERRFLAVKLRLDGVPYPAIGQQIGGVCDEVARRVVAAGWKALNDPSCADHPLRRHENFARGISGWTAKRGGKNERA
jgi:N6-adenosine-specific RNA methylase IME4